MNKRVVAFFGAVLLGTGVLLGLWGCKSRLSSSQPSNLKGLGEDAAALTVARAAQAFELSNIRAALVHRPGETVTLELQFTGGNLYQDSATVGLEALTVEMLLAGGTATRTPIGFRKRAEAIGADFQPVLGRDYSGVRVTCLRENLTAAFALLLEALLEPRFDRLALEYVRAGQLQALRQDANSPSAQLEAALLNGRFPGQPIALPPGGFPENLEFFGPAEVREQHRLLLNRNRIRLVASGELTAEAVADLLFGTLDQLPADPTEAPPRPSPPPPTALSVVEDSTVFPQLAAVFTAPPVGTLEYAALEAGLWILRNRLHTELCTRRQLSCDLALQLLPFRVPLGRLQFSGPKPGLALRYMRAIVAELNANGPTSAEVVAAQRTLRRRRAEIAYSPKALFPLLAAYDAGEGVLSFNLYAAQVAGINAPLVAKTLKQFFSNLTWAYLGPAADVPIGSLDLN